MIETNEIYAELSKKQLPLAENGILFSGLPSNVTLVREKNSRACFFYCEGEAEELVEWLENNRINWQEN